MWSVHLYPSGILYWYWFISSCTLTMDCMALSFFTFVYAKQVSTLMILWYYLLSKDSHAAIIHMHYNDVIMGAIASPWRSILMCNKPTSAGTSLEGTSMFAHVTLHRTFNPLGSKCWSSFLKTITSLIIHRFLSLKVLLLIYLLFKKHCIQYISTWKVVLDLVKGTWHHNFMAGCGSLLWANTCCLWSGIKSWPGSGCLQRQITSLTIVFSTAYSDTDQKKHQSSASLVFVQEIHQGPVNSPHKWPVTRKMFPFDDVIMPGNICAFRDCIILAELKMLAKTTPEYLLQLHT